MDKTAAIRLLRRNGHKLNENITYAARNGGVDIYWANPEIDFLSNDWSLILDDTHNRTLYLFDIPANSIAPTNLKYRSDKPNLIDLQIEYCDDNFTDTRSNMRFYPFLYADEQY